MRNHLPWVFFFCALTGFYIPSYGQEPGSKDLYSKIKEPLYIVNHNIIANGLLANLHQSNIKNIVVYKGENIPVLFRHIYSTAVIEIEYNDKIKSKTFAEIARQERVKGAFRVVINGSTLDAKQVSSLRIAPEAIGELQVTPAPNENSEAILSIRMVEPKPNNQKYPPGTIMIR